MKAHEFKHEMTNTSSIFGRNKDVQVIFEGNQAGTTGSEIVLPAIPDDVDLTLDQVKTMRGYVDHEAGHLRHSDMPLLMDKYKRWCDNGKEGLKNLHNCLEDIWMEDRVMREYPGSRKNLTATTESVNQRELEGLTPEHVKDFNVDSACLSITTRGRMDYNGPSGKEISDVLPEKLRDHADNWTKLARECSNSQEVIDLAKAVYKLIEEDPELQSSPEDFDPQSGSDVQDGEPDKEGQGEDGKGAGSQKPGSSGQGEHQPGQPLEGKDVMDGDIPGGIGCPQGDYKGSYRIYSTRHDKVVDHKNPIGKGGFDKDCTSEYVKVRSDISAVTATMKNKLRRALLAKTQRDWDFGREMGRLDSKRLVSGYNGNPSIYKRRVDREEEDTAIQVLVDLSGSMSGQKIELAQQSAIALAECFEGTALKYQVTGFDATQDDHRTLYEIKGSWHRADANNMYNFKPFDRGLRQSRSPLGGMCDTGMHNNADRDAIMWCVQELRRRPEKRKVLLVLSDGHPAHHTVNVGRDELIRHAKLAVEYGNSNGIECIGIGIMDKTVEKIYSDNVVINNLQDLSGAVFNKFTRLLIKGK